MGDKQKYNAWKDNLHQTKVRYSVSSPTISSIEAMNGYFVCTIDYPKDVYNKIQYVIQYQIKRKNEQQQKATHHHHKSHSAQINHSNMRNHRHSEFNTYKAESSLFIIRSHIWPNQKYQFRVRLVSKLFSSQKSKWCKWTPRFLAIPPSINALTSSFDNDDEKEQTFK